MFEKWGIIDVGTEFTYTTDCLEDIYTEDLNGGNTGIGWQSSSGYWECKIDGKTIIEDIEETPWNPIETSHEFLAESLDYDTQALDDDKEIL